MILIADSGSTKTDWVLTDKTKTTSYKTIGLNPFHTSPAMIVSEIRKLKINDFSGKIYFYGSGCANEEKNNIIKTSVSEVFPKSEIFVNSDILGAARGLLQDSLGMAGILGTGANCCFYNGKEIVFKGTALGYILGDDGSGAHLGKELARAVFLNDLSEEIAKDFKKEYKISKDILLDNVYNRPFANRYLAGFAPFLKKHEKKDKIAAIINKCLSAYFEKQIIKIPEYQKNKLSLTGSVAFHFSENIKNIAAKYSIEIADIVQSPMEGLIRFHK